jgi:nucleotide-binding universal stress UspA family protein
MKKISAAFDGLQFSESTMEYAISIAKGCDAHLLGVFLDDLIHHSYGFADLVSNEGGVSDKKMEMLNEKDEKTRKNSIRVFKKACENAGIGFSIHRDKNVAMKDLLHESIYSDLLIINRKEDFNIYREEIPSDFMRELLADVQSPVLVVPEKYKPFQTIIFLYDGDPSSMFAVKMFSYILGYFKHLPMQVLSVKSEKTSLPEADSNLMKEFVKLYFPDAGYTVLHGDPEETIVSFLEQQNEEVLVVLGAYRRSRVSRWFKRSMADILMSELKLPLFIAHNK